MGKPKEKIDSPPPLVAIRAPPRRSPRILATNNAALPRPLANTSFAGPSPPISPSWCEGLSLEDMVSAIVDEEEPRDLPHGHPHLTAPPLHPDMDVPALVPLPRAPAAPLIVYIEISDDEIGEVGPTSSQQEAVRATRRRSSSARSREPRPAWRSSLSNSAPTHGGPAADCTLVPASPPAALRTNHAPDATTTPLCDKPKEDAAGPGFPGRPNDFGSRQEPRHCQGCHRGAATRPAAPLHEGAYVVLGRTVINRPIQRVPPPPRTLGGGDSAVSTNAQQPTTTSSLRGFWRTSIAAITHHGQSRRRPPTTTPGQVPSPRNQSRSCGHLRDGAPRTDGFRSNSTT
ncbi:uncharacterized protein LOC108037429 [Drosophila rhopaloa]|uniref:Uncharacterized protein n=1 Tax=Drosophila rhopaloa TaxID=1041015 RepID=A0ABM5GUE6_DRORH|nr:uncharacterized protein LOC108037429 [Drosophila rhopaloa]